MTPENWVREEPLVGDASTRRYSRLWDDGGNTAILVRYPRSIRWQLERDLAVRAWCFGRGLRVPSLAEHDVEAGWAVVEDFGFDDAEQSVALASPVERHQLCIRALQPLEVFASLAEADLPRWNRPLDAERLRWELAGFELWCVTPRLNAEPSARIGRWLDGLAENIDRHPRRICHRDFHLNNFFFLADQEVGLIDYQDILIGPDTYDMVSLLRERSMPDLVDENTLSTVECVWAERTAAEPGWQERQQQVRLQRALKVLGTFARLVAAGDSSYQTWLTTLAANLAAEPTVVNTPSELVDLLLDLGPRGSSL